MFRWVVVLFLVLFSGAAVADPADAVLGEWTTPEGKSKVDIYKCGARYCGKIVWLKIPEYEADHPRAGQTKVDLHNPEPSLRDTPLVGLNIISGFTYEGDGVWEDGEIYDPENGKTYSCKMTLENKNILNVRGYIGISLIGRTSVWTR